MTGLPCGMVNELFCGRSFTDVNAYFQPRDPTVAADLIRRANGDDNEDAQYCKGLLDEKKLHCHEVRIRSSIDPRDA